MHIQNSFLALTTAVTERNKLLGSSLQEAADQNAGAGPESQLSLPMLSAVASLQHNPISQEAKIKDLITKFLEQLPKITFSASASTQQLPTVPFALHSPVLQSKIVGIWKTNTNTNINLDDISAEALTLYASFLATEQLDPTKALHELEDLFKIADQWQDVPLIQELTWIIYQLKNDLNPETLSQISQLANLYNNVALMALNEPNARYYPHFMQVEVRNVNDLDLYRQYRLKPSNFPWLAWHITIHTMVNGLPQLLEASMCPQEVHIATSKLSESALLQIFTSLQNIANNGPVLQKLTLGNSSLTTKACTALAEAISLQKNLISLDISDCTIAPQGIALIAQAIQQHPSLTHVDIGKNTGTDDELVQMTQSLNCLSIKDCELTFDRLEVIMQEPTKCYFTELDLSGNTLKSLGPNFLHFVETTKRLTSLTLSQCDLTPEAVKNLLLAIDKAKTVVSLTLSKNTISDEAATVLAEILKNSSYLQKIELQSCHLSTTAIALVCQAIEKNSWLLSLNLSNNPLDAPTCQLLANALSVNTVLKELSLMNTQLSDESAKPLIEVAKMRTTATELNLYNNKLSDDLKNKLETDSERFTV